jgi:hypothetical protein
MAVAASAIADCIWPDIIPEPWNRLNRVRLRTYSSIGSPGWLRSQYRMNARSKVGNGRPRPAAASRRVSINDSKSPPGSRARSSRTGSTRPRCSPGGGQSMPLYSGSARCSAILRESVDLPIPPTP